MDFAGLMRIVGAILLSFGGGAVIVAALSGWLGALWAKRILASEDANRQREFEALVRRRDVYPKLAVTMRALLRRHEDPQIPEGLKDQFLAAYDQAAVWAPDPVMNAVGHLLDLSKGDATGQPAGSQEQRQQAYVACITEMRKDSGFPDSTFAYR